MNIIDLFSGVGGFSLGASYAGFNVAAAFDNDSITLSTHKKNFPSTQHYEVDINNLPSIRSLVNFDEITGIIGGPPCQGFSSMGHRNVDDIRNTAFNSFFRLVEQENPSFFIAENVPGILQPQYDCLREKAINLVENNFLLLEPCEVIAHRLGVPTTRTRILFIGFNRELFATHPPVSSFEPSESVFIAKVKDALGGLPSPVAVENPHEDVWLKVKRKTNPYLRLLTREPPSGVGDPNVVSKFRKGILSGFPETKHTLSVSERFSSLEQGCRDPVSRANRLSIDGFAPTLRAGTGSDRGSFQALRPIHPIEPRVITPREAARLQGFPDWFYFHPTKWHAFRQIGNSVSPIVSEHILNVVRELIEEAQNQNVEEAIA
ncbi:MAG: DNA cytosine methyltransferase [Opitutales bacterium]|nr:DNA cytosine methyltransferase [Opitutales bacterium]